MDKELFEFLAGTRSKLSAGSMNLYIEVSPNFTFAIDICSKDKQEYRLKTYLLEELKTFLSKNKDQLEALYEENSIFIDYCVNNHLLTRERVFKFNLVGFNETTN